MSSPTDSPEPTQPLDAVPEVAGEPATPETPTVDTATAATPASAPTAPPAPPTPPAAPLPPLPPPPGAFGPVGPAWAGDPTFLAPPRAPRVRWVNPARRSRVIATSVIGGLILVGAGLLGGVAIGSNSGSHHRIERIGPAGREGAGGFGFPGNGAASGANRANGGGTRVGPGAGPGGNRFGGGRTAPTGGPSLRPAATPSSTPTH